MRSLIEFVKESNNVSYTLIEDFLSNYIHDNFKISDTLFDISDIEEYKPITITFKTFKDIDENNIKNLKIVSVPLFRNKFITFKIFGSELMKNKLQKRGTTQ